MKNYFLAIASVVVLASTQLASAQQEKPAPNATQVDKKNQMDVDKSFKEHKKGHHKHHKGGHGEHNGNHTSAPKQ